VFQFHGRAFKVVVHDHVVVVSHGGHFALRVSSLFASVAGFSEPRFEAFFEDRAGRRRDEDRGCPGGPFGRS
jgi:hypothetical protein